MQQALEEMYLRLIGRRTLHPTQRPLFRNVLYGAIFLLLLYSLYHVMGPQNALPFPDEVDVEPTGLPLHVWEDNAAQVKRAFLHAYHGYERYAAPHDELKPLSNGKINNFNGWGVSIFDSLDTMLVMGLQHEFDRAMPMVKRVNFSLTEDKYVPYFETIIRYLGGLLSAYALSRNQMLLERADELATKLDPVFSSKTGLPFYGVSPASGKAWGPEIGILAEMASLQLEYTYLAKVTGKKEHFTRANTVINVLAAADLRHTGGMFPVKWGLVTGQPFDSHLSVGAQADSAHEYLLKQYLMTAKTDKKNLVMYIRTTTHILSNLLYLSPTRHLLYVTDTVSPSERRGPVPTHLFEHLSCFLPGLLALGAHTLPLDNLESLGIDLNDLSRNGSFGDAETNYRILADYDLKKMHLWAAEGLAQTCWLTYADQPSGLGPDEVIMKRHDETKTNRWGGKSNLWIETMGRWKRSGSRGLPPGVADKTPVVYTEKERNSATGRGRDYAIKKAGYLLRPETIESLYFLWRVTGDTKWRIRGLKIFHAIEKQTKTPSGYASLRSVEVSPAPKDDSMPSYFLAETLKYLYLMFIDEDPIPLDKWVFNTEAHPFPIFQWNKTEKEHFDI